jgi:hypothetical protein
MSLSVISNFSLPCQMGPDRVKCIATFESKHDCLVLTSVSEPDFNCGSLPILIEPNKCVPRAAVWSWGPAWRPGDVTCGAAGRMYVGANRGRPPRLALQPATHLLIFSDEDFSLRLNVLISPLHTAPGPGSSRLAGETHAAPPRRRRAPRRRGGRHYGSFATSPTIPGRRPLHTCWVLTPRPPRILSHFSAHLRMRGPRDKCLLRSPPLSG